NAPPLSLGKPRVDSLSLNISVPGHHTLTITGANFGTADDSLSVRFRVGTNDNETPAKLLSDTQLQVEVPTTVALGTAGISVVREVGKKVVVGIIGQRAADTRLSNTVTFLAPGGYGFVVQQAPAGQDSQLAAFDTRAKV